MTLLQKEKPRRNRSQSIWPIASKAPTRVESSVPSRPGLDCNNKSQMMFGRKQSEENLVVLPTRAAASPKRPAAANGAAPSAPRSPVAVAQPVEETYEIKSNDYYDIKQELFNALIEIVDVVQIAKMDPAAARTEIRDV